MRRVVDILRLWKKKLYRTELQRLISSLKYSKTAFDSPISTSHLI